MADWPSDIKIGRENYKETPPNRVSRSNMSVGPDKIRRRSTAAVRPLSISMTLTGDQVDILDTFYLENDSLSFNFTHPRTETVEKARFVSAPQYKLRETIYDVSVELEILP